MPSKIWYATSNLASVHQQMSETDPGTEIFATPATGWIGGAGNTLRSPFKAQTEQLASTFNSIAYPDGTIDVVNGDCLRTFNAYLGFFDSGTWNFVFSARAQTAIGCSGIIHCRLFRGSAPDGSNAVEVTSGDQASAPGAVTFATQTFIVTISLPGFNLTGEYLFVQLAWERTVAGGATSDINMRIGNASGTGTRLVSPAFTQNYTPMVINIPWAVGSGLVYVPNSGIRPRSFEVEPSFLLTMFPAKWGNFGFGPGYVGKYYLTQWVLQNQLTPIHFILAGGALPPGLYLSDIGANAGQVDGIPTKAGTYEFTLIAAGPLSTDNRNFTIEIEPYFFPLGVVGVGYVAKFLESDGVAATVLLTQGALPPGLTMSAVGVVSGTPTKEGRFDFTVEITIPEGTSPCDLFIVIQADPGGGGSGFIYGN